MKFWKLLLWIAGIITLSIFLNLLLVKCETAADGSITSFSNAIWYMIVTLTTVGYGDYYPVSTTGRVIGYIYVLASLGIIGLLFSTISNKIISMQEEKKMGFHGTSYENHIIILGWGEFSKLVADEISHTQKKMAIITDKKDDIDLIYEKYGKTNIFVLFSELQNFESLSKVNTAKASVAFIGLPNDSDALLYVLDFKKNYPNPDIVVSLQKPQLKDTFRTAGVTYVIARNEIASKLVASYIFEPDVADLNIDLISTSRSETEYDIQEYCVLEKNPYNGSNYLDAFYAIKKDYDCVLIGLTKFENGNRKILTNPEGNTPIHEGDYLMLMGNGIAKTKIKSAFSVEEGRQK